MCDGDQLMPAMALTPTPPGNNFLRAEELDAPEPRYPLELRFCRDCFHVQLAHVVDPRILYQRNYSYVSGTSSAFVGHLRDYAETMMARYELSPGALVSDIGSNDGTCLRFFQQAGAQVLGVDPATEIARRATEAGVPTVGDFFSLEVATRLRQSHGPAAFITSHNACAHIDHLDDVMRGVHHWLADDGVFVLEVGYLLDVYRNLWFDTIYHEHLDYHTVAPFQRLCARTGLQVIDAERVSPQGGSIRLAMQKIGGSRAVSPRVQALIDLEREAGLQSVAAFEQYSRRIDAVGQVLRDLVRDLRAQGRSVAAFGAATKTTTLLGHFGLGAADLDFIADDNPLKQGLFSPASHIPVVSADEIYSRRPDYLLITAWNFAEPIMAAHQRYVDEGGRFILPMPEARVVS